MLSRYFLPAALVYFILMASCGSGLKKVIVKIKGTPLTVEIAGTDSEREHGLMDRKKLGKYTGMLFVFKEDQHLSFWMKDTFIPLSIAFLSREGKILEIEDMKPMSERIIRSKYSSRFALEVNKGLFNEIGASVGDYVEFPADFKKAY
ncbi:MAG: DUF192 domain-containing protein [Spirochaetes bacterium]|nr:DUF192 domain-containing protein [Spirochaetota bacterium]